MDKKFKNLFLQQSYLDSWGDYERSLQKESFARWDYVILTASNENQAEIYRREIQYRLDNHMLSPLVCYAVLPDPEGKRVGSGGATLNVLRYIAEQEGNGRENHFSGKRILVIHSGGDSKRVPQYSVCGKLFSPVPRELPNGHPSTLFDEFIIAMSGVPSRFKDGMIVLSGDVLLLFNPLQLDFQYHDVAAISIKAPMEIGKDHGVFLSDESDTVRLFLHKQPEETLRRMGAVNENGFVNLDTGAILLSTRVLNALFSLVSTDSVIDEGKFSEFVNDQARISFYGDFLYPLASESTMESFYSQPAEGTFNDELASCRSKIWKYLSDFSIKLLCLSPAEFIHFGTTHELLRLVTNEIGDYEYLGWNKHVLTNASENGNYAVHRSYLGHTAKIGKGAYIENSYILHGSTLGEGAVASNVRLDGSVIRPHTVVNGLKLRDGRYVIRLYGVKDNPKNTLEQGCSFLNTSLEAFLTQNHLPPEDIWQDDQHYLWFANLYPACTSMEQVLEFVEILYRMAEGTASEEEVVRWKSSERMSLYQSFNEADGVHGFEWKRALKERILTSRFLQSLQQGQDYRIALKVFGDMGITESIFNLLIQDAAELGFAEQIRVYYAISQYMKHNNLKLCGKSYDAVEGLCFGRIQRKIYESAIQKLPYGENHIKKDFVQVQLPVRVNWGGGWTDTPPYCIEKGGVVLNAAIKLNGTYPIRVRVRRLDQYCVELESKDINAFKRIDRIEEIQQYNDPFDSFALHKAALISCGIIPLKEKTDLQSLLKKLGGGIYLSTEVVGIPRGSGLGTSSILSAACVKALFEFLGKNVEDRQVSEVVLCMEQVMSTGGGWQDQIGGLIPGVKFITSDPGLNQELNIQKVSVPEVAMRELRDRFALIYTGQRRLARNLLRDVVGGYIGANPQTVEALSEMKPIAALMRFALEQGNIGYFAELMNRHWEISQRLDHGSTNTCIDQIFMVCEDLIDGRFIAGAGGGGFLQVLLKKGVTHEDLQKRLRDVFQDSGVAVWESEFV